MKYYLVENKSDDYGNCITEIVETTPKLAKEYYNHKEISDDDIVIIKKYFDIVNYDEEKERTKHRRFYGNE